ncbi:MAG: YraN family protein [Gemmatimonadaceae bacterium]
MTTATQELGALGERIAERWMRRKGWRLIGKRFRNGHRDIDLVVECQDTVVFVEVKARSRSDYGSPVEAVTWRKQRELSRSARVWIDRFGRPGQAYRFDVVGVLVSGGDVRVHHVENAFSIPG